MAGADLVMDNLPGELACAADLFLTSLLHTESRPARMNKGHRAKRRHYEQVSALGQEIGTVTRCHDDASGE